MGWNKGLMAGAAVGALVAAGYAGLGAIRAEAASAAAPARITKVDDFRLPDHRFGSLQLYRDFIEFDSTDLDGLLKPVNIRFVVENKPIRGHGFAACSEDSAIFG